LRSRSSLVAFLAALGLAAGVLVGCGGGGGGDGNTLRLGYFPNLTHGPALVALDEGIFDRRVTALKVKPQKFSTGTEAIASMLAGSLDASYIGMGPVITALSRAPGSVRVVAGVSEAGAVLVARRGSGIRSVADLRDHTVGFPGFGNTQDLALRDLLADAGLRPESQGGSVRMVRIRNADLRTAFERGALDATLAPEPWGATLVDLDLADVVLPADKMVNAGRYPTTVLVVRAAFADAHPEAVAQLVAANREAVALAQKRPDLVSAAFTKAAKGKVPSPPALAAAVASSVPGIEVNREGTSILLQAARDAGYLAKPVGLDQLIPPTSGS
jgi:NitT/TauT family transport system substrate-binding protein